MSREEWLSLIARTDGMECHSEDFDKNLEELITENVVTRSLGRGPGRQWHRLEIMESN